MADQRRSCVGHREYFALSALASRMEQVIVKQGKDALTADTVFVSANPLSDSLLKSTEQLERSVMTRFSTMAFSDNGMQLISVRGVDESYPLMGELVLDGNESGRVKPNQLWLDERIMAQLEVNKVTMSPLVMQISPFQVQC